ncbi:RDD family protein [Streptomyces sp. NPDC006879]|uniref:RDD family protein n=1 Tax=Streptomyces sp. NPDC006879 TaxID=3364767 RepID=UPI0036ADDE90
MTDAPDDGGNMAREGFYPDPSVPGFVRYWNGQAWAPGTSRPAKPGELSASGPAGTTEETGPVFLDEDPEIPTDPVTPTDSEVAHASQARPGIEPADAVPVPRVEPASAWQADAARQSGFGGDHDQRVSWGGSAPDPRVPARPADPVAPARPHLGAPAAEASSRDPYAAPVGSAGAAVRDPRLPAPAPEPAPLPGEPAAPEAEESTPAAQPRAVAQESAPLVPAQPGPVAAQAWEQQVQQLARPGEDWRPPPADVFQQMAENSARPAGLGRRLAARLLDSVVYAAVAVAVAVPLLPRTTAHLEAKIDAAKLQGRTVTVWLLDATTAGHLGLVLATLLLFGVVYEALPTAKWGATLGKRLLGLRVRDTTAQQPPSFGASLRRWLTYGVLGSLGVGVLGAAWCLFDRPWRQGWHDKAAGTFVGR